MIVYSYFGIMIVYSYLDILIAIVIYELLAVISISTYDIAIVECNHHHYNYLSQ